MASNPNDVVYDLLEKYITFLAFDEKLDYLAQFIRTGKLESVTNAHNPQQSLAFGKALEKTLPRLTREDIVFASINNGCNHT